MSDTVDTPKNDKGLLRQFHAWTLSTAKAKFSELVRLLEKDGFKIVKEKGSIRYYGNSGWDKLIRIDYHGSKEVPTGTCHSIIKAAGIK